MRLIDADVQVKYFEGLARSLANAECFAAADVTQCAAETLRIAPTIDAEPVRHGQWIEDGPDWVCSYCGTEFKDDIEFIKLDYDYYMPHYCPHCGAKMDLEVSGDA